MCGRPPGWAVPQSNVLRSQRLRFKCVRVRLSRPPESPPVTAGRFGDSESPADAPGRILIGRSTVGAAARLSSAWPPDATGMSASAAVATAAVQSLRRTRVEERRWLRVL